MSRRVYKYAPESVLERMFDRPGFCGVKCSYPKDYNDPYELFLGAEKSPTGDLIDFYQVKTKTAGQWTITALTGPKKNAPAPSSIIGKMYQNAAIFGEATRSIRFLSNAGFKLTGADGKPFSADVDRIAASAIHPDEQKAIRFSSFQLTA